tara:strand:- start:157 stop:2148 length:1992 start_codon:yes stop_codon:yes gene_type:complete
MSRVTSFQSNFTTGEIDPLLRSRTDIKQYYNGLSSATNVLVQPQGGVTRRPGLQYIGTIPSASNPQSGCRLVPFEFSTTQSYMLLFVNNRMYVYKGGVLQTGINGGGNDYLTTSIGSANIGTMNWTQSADTLIIVQEDMAPKKIVRGGSHSTWTISDISFDFTPKYAFTLSTSEPSGTLTPSAVDGNVTLTASASVFASGNINDYVEAKDGIGRARIIDFASATSVKAIVEVPFFSTDALANGDWVLETDYVDAWSATYGYPRSCVFHEGRLYFGGSKTLPTGVWASRVNDFFDFNPGEGLDDDGIFFSIDTDQMNAINGIVSGRDLQLFTKGGEFYLPQSDLNPITPSNVVVRPSTRRGSKDGIRPVIAESGTLFIQRSGKSLREFNFSDVELSYISNNISLLSSHLLKAPSDMALRRATSTDEGDLLLIVNGTDGNLTTYSILKGQQVVAPSSQTTDGDFINVGVDVDTTYFVIKRSINGSTVYNVEKWNDDFTLDSAVQYSTVAGNLPGSTSISGLTHLEAKSVKVINNGRTLADETVSSGAITSDETPAIYIEVGLDYTPTITTMPVETQLPSGTIIGMKKRILEATLILYLTENITLNGSDVSVETFPVTLGSNNIFTGKKRIMPLMGYDNQGQITISQSAPLFFTLLGLEYKVSTGQ